MTPVLNWCQPPAFGAGGGTTSAGGGAAPRRCREPGLQCELPTLSRSPAMPSRLPLLAMLAVAPLAGLAQAPAKADASGYPSRPITLVVSFPPGAGADLTARTVAQKMSESMGQPVVVDNRAGANGIVGTGTVARAAPDGYTILLTDRGALGINPSLYRKLAYDPLKDFEY